MAISVEASKELLWWKGNLTLCNGRSLISPPQIIISSDASLKDWPTNCHVLTTGRPWHMVERMFHINVLELKAAKLAIIFFTLKKRFTSPWATWQPCPALLKIRPDQDLASMARPKTRSWLRSAKKFGNTFRSERSRLLPNTYQGQWM